MKSTFVQPYLIFAGRCAEAIEFYQSAVGAEVETMMRFSECPDPLPPEMLEPGFEEKIMHAAFRIGESTILASDGCDGSSGLGGFSLSITVPDTSDAERIFTALTEGGEVKMPLEKTFWSPLFGMGVDRFGIGWMVSVEN